MVEADRILVGVIGAPHGVQGELRVKSFTADPSTLPTLGPLTSVDGARSFTVTKSRRLKDDMLVVRLAGVADRTAAAALTNVRLYVARTQLPAAGEDEFYHADLVDLQVERADGSGVGRIVAVQNFGAGDLLEIAPAEGETVLIPFTKVFVPIVDLPGRRVVASDEAFASPDRDDIPDDDQ